MAEYTIGLTWRYSVVPALFLVLFTITSPGEVKGDRRPFGGRANEKGLSINQLVASNCTPPKPREPNTILKWRKGRSNKVFLPGEKAEFVCKKGFRQIGWLKAFICQEDGSWKPSSISTHFENNSSLNMGYCLTTICNGSKTFNCTDGSTVIDVCHMCDCVADCPDASDEMSCDATLINVTGQAIGVIKYPVPSPHKSVEYAGVMECKRTLWTDDPGFYIKLWFTNFSLPPNCERNHVSLENVTFTDPERSPMCCKQTEDVPCRFGEHSSTPLSRTLQNWMTISLVTEKSSSSKFSATWYNVNAFFPKGFLPKDDPAYSDRFRINTTPSKAPATGGHSEAYIAAVVIFSLVVFTFLFLVGCKIGQYFCGARCTVAYCFAWIAAKRARRTRALRGESEDRPNQDGSPRRGANNVDPSRVRTRYGSDGNDNNPDAVA